MRAALLALACSCCLGSLPPAGYVAPIIPSGGLPPGRAAETRCSFNNLPVIAADPEVLLSAHAELMIRHEYTHAASMIAYRGGCWAYLRRYTRDRLFRIREEMAAYCAEGRLALERNRSPDSAWERIVRSMAADTVLTDKDNCLFDPGPPR